MRGLMRGLMRAIGTVVRVHWLQYCGVFTIFTFVLYPVGFEKGLTAKWHFLKQTGHTKDVFNIYIQYISKEVSKTRGGSSCFDSKMFVWLHLRLRGRRSTQHSPVCAWAFQFISKQSITAYPPLPLHPQPLPCTSPSHHVPTFFIFSCFCDRVTLVTHKSRPRVVIPKQDS